MPVSFGIHTADECLEDFRKRAELFQKEPLNEQLANDCAIAAWSVCDWVFSSHGAQLGYGNLNELQKNCISKCPELSYLRDVANARKHKEISKYSPALIEPKKHGGAFSRDFSRDFDISALMLVTKTGQELWMEDVVDAALRFWDDYFRKNGLR